MWIWIWLGVVAASLIIEFMTMELISVWFLVGGILALILAALKVPVEVQISVFVVTSLVFLLVLRKPLLKKIIKPTQKTNTDALIGESFDLLSDIKFDLPGTIKINGVIWSAVAEDGQEIEKGTIVDIVSIKGNKILVAKSKKEKK